MMSLKIVVLGVGLLHVLVFSVTYLQADDQFECCMKGIKTIRNIRVCPAPCCYGYVEKVVYASRLSRISFCTKEKAEDMSIDGPFFGNIRKRLEWA